MNPSSPPPRVLVVDDEAGFRELCMDLLMESGYYVDVAQNGREGLRFLEKGTYQLALCDIHMPVMNGIEFLKTAKAKYPQTEIILMTAFGGLQTALEALRFGAYDYITKPFTREGLLVIVRRCLEKQRLSQELRLTQDELIKKEKLATLGSMAAWLAHRMRNPLNVILMCSQYLKEKFPHEDERHEVASAIEDRVKVLEKMTRDFIQFSRSYHLKLRAEDIHQILDHVLENMESRTKFQSVNVEKNYAPALPPVPLDRDLMEEIFGNLFDNAVEAMGGPGVLRIRTERTAQGIMLDVSDTGPAIPPEVREHLFEPFYTTKDSGTGLGLAIVRRVVESFGGRISLLPTQATTFRIELPVSPADAAPEEAEAWKNA